MELWIYGGSNIFFVGSLKFNFHGAIQDGLIEAKTDSNIHRICCFRNSIVIPVVLCFCSNVGSRYITDAAVEDEEVTKLLSKKPQTFRCSDEFVELAAARMRNGSLEMLINEKRSRGTLCLLGGIFKGTLMQI